MPGMTERLERDGRRTDAFMTVQNWTAAVGQPRYLP
jgi:hypothetical protein